MLNPDRVYMLAADHRWQWEEFCDARGISRGRIADAKRVAYDGFVAARRESPAARQFGAMLLDEQYASPIIAAGIAAGMDIGTPAEKAGAFPLAWATDPFDRALTGTFVKVLFNYRPDHEASIRDEQFAKLQMLHEWCERAGKPLVIEILVRRQHEPETDFDATGRPAIVASVIRDAYRRGLTPAFWKIEGTPSAAGARMIDAAVAERPDGRQIILGKAADMATIRQWFAAAAPSTTAAGFAIGRSVFWRPCADFLAGTLAAASASRDVADNYTQLIRTWEEVRSVRTTVRPDVCGGDGNDGNAHFA